MRDDPVLQRLAQIPQLSLHVNFEWLSDRVKNALHVLKNNKAIVIQPLAAWTVMYPLSLMGLFSLLTKKPVTHFKILSEDKLRFFLLTILCSALVIKFCKNDISNYTKNIGRLFSYKQSSNHYVAILDAIERTTRAEIIVPNELCCVITKNIMINPVCIFFLEGATLRKISGPYEETALKAWLTQNKKIPTTGETFDPDKHTIMKDTDVDQATVEFMLDQMSRYPMRWVLQEHAAGNMIGL